MEEKIQDNSNEIFDIHLAFVLDKDSKKHIASRYSRKRDSLVITGESAETSRNGCEKVNEFSRDHSGVIDRIKEKYLKNPEKANHVDFLYEDVRGKMNEPRGEIKSRVFDSGTFVAYYLTDILNPGDFKSGLVFVPLMEMKEKIDEVNYSIHENPGNGKRLYKDLFMEVEGKEYNINRGLSKAAEELIKKFKW